MIHFIRTSSIAPGKVADAMAFAAEMNDYLATRHGQKMVLMVPIGGNPHRLCWHTSFASLGDMETFQAKTLSDPQYLSLLGKGTNVFIPGTAHDDIWREV